MHSTILNFLRLTCATRATCALKREPCRHRPVTAFRLWILLQGMGYSVYLFLEMHTKQIVYIIYLFYKYAEVVYYFIHFLFHIAFFFFLLLLHWASRGIYCNVSGFLFVCLFICFFLINKHIRCRCLIPYKTSHWNWFSSTLNIVCLNNSMAQQVAFFTPFFFSFFFLLFFFCFFNSASCF